MHSELGRFIDPYCDFGFKHIFYHFIHDVRLMEINSNKEFYPKMSFVFIEMPKFQKSEGQLENELDEWLFILNNLNNLSQFQYL